MKTIFCPIRKVELKADGEERVRVALLHQLMDELGFPSSLITVEKGLEHFSDRPKAVQRRIDILCYGKNKEGTLFPLLLIECKALKIDDKVIRQVLGYNQYLKATFVAVSNGSEVKTGWIDHKSNQYRFISGIPSYRELISSLGTA